MDSLKDTLEAVTGLPQVPYLPSRRALMGLPSTDSILDRLDRALTLGRVGDAKRLQPLLARCQLRDTYQAERPEGCFCLGTGQPHYQAGLKNASTVWAYCSCEEGLARKERDVAAGIAQTETRLGVERRLSWQQAGIPDGFAAFRLETSPHAAEIAAGLRERGGSAYLWGEYGVGKTGLAIGLAYDRLQSDVGNDGRAFSVAYTPAPDLFTRLRATYNSAGGPTESQVLWRFTGVDLLVLDDLGTEQMSGSGWVEDRLYQIIGGRHAAGKPMFITSNYSIEQIGKRLGERIAWRIVEACGKDNIIHVEGANLREAR